MGCFRTNGILEGENAVCQFGSTKGVKSQNGAGLVLCNITNKTFEVKENLEGLREKISKVKSGGGGSRTRVRSYDSKNFYTHSLFLFDLKVPDRQGSL